MPFYLKRDGVVVGPYARAELKDMLKHGEIRANVPAKEEDDQFWSTLEICLSTERRQVADKPPSPIPARFRGQSFAMKSLGSTLGVSAYKKFAAATRRAARSVSGISLHRKSPRSSPRISSRNPATPTGDETRHDLIHGAIWGVGGLLAIILGRVLTAETSVDGLYWIFGGPVAFGAFLFLRGLFRLLARR